jgi:hypothetical protein
MVDGWRHPREREWQSGPRIGGGGSSRSGGVCPHLVSLGLGFAVLAWIGGTA